MLIETAYTRNALKASTLLPNRYTEPIQVSLSRKGHPQIFLLRYSNINEKENEQKEIIIRKQIKDVGVAL